MKMDVTFSESNNGLSIKLDNGCISDNVVSEKHTWSSKNAVDKLCPSFTESGSAVICEPVETYPLDVVTSIEVVQTGSGDPSPENVRPFVGVSALCIDHHSKNYVPDNWKDWNSWTSQRMVLDLHPGQYCIWAERTSDAYLYIERSTDGGATWEIKGICDNKTDGYILAGSARNTRTFTVKEGELWSLWCSVNYHKAVTWIQIEPGTQKTAYAPYLHNKVSVDFGQIAYSGTYNWSTGVLTLDKASKVFNGTEDWSKYIAYGVYLTQISDKAVGYNTSVCDSFKNTKNADAFTNGKIQPGLYTDHITNPTVYFDWGESSNTVEEWKAWLAERYANGQPVTLVYDLATPIQIQLTPQEFVAFQGVNALYCKDGITVTGRSDPGIIIEKLTNAIIALGGNV